MKTILNFLAIFFLFFSFDSMAQTETFEVESLSISESPNPNNPTTTIEFEEEKFDFGEIKEGTNVHHVFKFVNSGDNPLIITKAKGSCGCTVPFFPKEPIMPGEQSEIEVVFNSKGKQNQQTKKVTIFANTNPESTFLTISANVLPSEGEEVMEEEGWKLEQEATLKQTDESCIAIFPNPTTDILQLELKEHIGETAMVEIYNDRGQLIMQDQIQGITRQTTQFNVSDYIPGVYIIAISFEGSPTITQCFMVVN